MPVIIDASALASLSSWPRVNTSHRYQTPRQKETTPKPTTAARMIDPAGETL